MKVFGKAVQIPKQYLARPLYDQVVEALHRPFHPVVLPRETVRAETVRAQQPSCRHPAYEGLGFQASTSHHWCPDCGALRSVWSGGASDWRIPHLTPKDTP